MVAARLRPGGGVTAAVRMGLLGHDDACGDVQQAAQAVLCGPDWSPMGPIWVRPGWPGLQHVLKLTSV